MSYSKIFMILSVFLAGVSCCPADNVDGFPNETGKEKELAKLVGEAYVWNHFWFNDWGKNFDKGLKIGKKETVGVSVIDDKVKKQKGYSIFFDSLPSDLSFYKDGSWWAPDVLEDYNDERLSLSENKKAYLDSKAMHSDSMKSFEVRFDKNIFKVLDFGKFGVDKKKFVEDVFVKKIFVEDIDSFRKVISRNSKNGISIRVGNFNLNYPVFYYYVEGLDYEGGEEGKGMPYLGSVLFDPKTRNLIHNDIVGNDVKPIKRKYKNAISRIRQTGITLRYKDGHFVETK